MTMKRIAFTFAPRAAFFAFAFTFISCDKDFTEIGNGIVGDDHFSFSKFDGATVAANTVATGPVQANNLPINALGVYDNPAFGKTIASFVTQLEMKSPAPKFHTEETNPEIVSVKLTVPYFSTLRSTDSNGNRTYELDSIYGPNLSPIDLALHESTYFLGDLTFNDQGEQQPMRYFSNQGSDITHNAALLNNIGGAENSSAFTFKPDQRIEVVTAANGTTSERKLAPAMEMELDKDFFWQKIFQAPAGTLQGNNTFKNYFRGIYFKVNPSGTQPGQLSMLNFKEGIITIKYKEDVTVTSNGVTTTTRPEKDFVLRMTGNTVSLLRYENVNPQFATGLAQPFNPAVGQTELWVKGGEGSVVTLDLFGPDADNNGVADELEQIRANKWMINEASLTFYINQDRLGSSSEEPTRLYLYDVRNKRPIADYFSDNSTNRNPKFIKNVHSGIIQRESTGGRGFKYKVRLTNYMRSLVQRDSTNVRLGLAVTESISNVAMVKTREEKEAIKNFLPGASVIHPLGTVLYGSHPDVPADRRLKLEIYYTKPN
jgi:hypothetical protein